jgi:septum formation protein
MKIILGSSSPWRKEVLKSMGFDFKVLSPDIDEKAIRDVDPTQLTLQIARAKTEALLYVISL